MKTYLLPSDKIKDYIRKLADEGLVFYPQVENGKAHLVRFDQDKDFEPNFKMIRTAENVKHFFFPSRDIVARFPKDVRKKPVRQFLVGIKNCDLRGIDVYDRVFLKTEPVDPVYRNNREAICTISADCPEPEDCCFCNLVGLKPFCESLSDINISEIEHGFLFEVFTDKGRQVIDSLSTFFKEATSEDLKEREKIRKNAVKKLDKINEGTLKENTPARIQQAGAALMHEARKGCVECFGCLHACPTCYCFLLSDHRKGSDFDRVRTWDACYYAAYARVGGGANPRSELDKRFWNRFQCKFNYFHEYEGIYACSGCGRCYRGCSAQIDIREILWKL